MKNFSFIVVLLFLWAFNSQAQITYPAGDYNYTGSLNVGKKVPGYNSFSPTNPNAWLEVGNSGSTRGFITARITDTSSVSPILGMFVYSIAQAGYYVGKGTYWQKAIGTTDSVFVQKDSIFVKNILGENKYLGRLSESSINLGRYIITAADETTNTNQLIELLDAGFKRIFIPDSVAINYESIADGKLANVSIIKGSDGITFGKSSVLGFPASNDTHLSLQPLKRNKVTGLWISGKDPYPQTPDGTGTYNTLKIGWEDLEEQLRAGTDHYGDFGLTLQKDGYNGFGAVRFNTKENGDFTGDWPSMEFTFQNNSPTYKAMTIALLKPIANADATGIGYNYGGRDKAFWYAGRPTTSGQYIVVNYNVYKATTTGTTGNTKPVHTSGTVSDGGVSWQWIESVAPNVTGINWRPVVIFGATNSFTTAPFNRASVHFAERSLVYPQMGFDFINGAKNAVVGSIEALSQTTKGLKLIADSATNKFISISDTRLKLNNVPLVPTILSKTNNSTTFEVSTGGIVAFNDDAPTNFTQFTGGITGQVIVANFNTANTTLVESANLKLNGSGNITPPANSSAEFYIENSTTARLVGLGNINADCAVGFVDIEGNVQDNASLDSAFATKVGGIGVAERMAFWNSSNRLSSGANFYIDSVNSRMGILTNSPTHTMTFAQGNTGIANYNTIDQVTNYERFRSYWNSNVWTMSTDAAGSGTNRPIAFSANGSVFTLGNPSKGFEFNRNGANITTIFDIGSSIGNALTASSGLQSGLQIDPTISQTGTAGYHGLYISPFENSTGSGSKLLIDVGTNSAAQNGGTHTSKFSVDNAGVVTATAPVVLTSTTGNGYLQLVNGTTPSAPSSAIRAFSNAGGFSFINSSGDVASIYASTGTSSFTLPAGTNTAATMSSAQVLTNKTIDGDDNTLSDISTASLKTEAARGYSLQATHGSTTLSASTIYYFGGMAGNITTTAQRNKLYIPAAGTIKKAYVSYFNGGTLASTEAITFAIRHNNTTDYTVSNSATLDAITTDFNSTSLNIAVAAGDFIELKVTTPAFVTAPTVVRCSVVLWIE